MDNIFDARGKKQNTDESAHWWKKRKPFYSAPISQFFSYLKQERQYNQIVENIADMSDPWDVEDMYKLSWYPHKEDQYGQHEIIKQEWKCYDIWH
jgi:hypothetical protein